MNAGARADGTKMLHDRCHRWHLPGTARGSPRHRGDTRPMLHTAFAPRGPLMPDSAQHMVQTAPWLKNRTSNLLERISFSVSRINNSHTEVASFSAFLWPSPNFRSLREKHTRSWKIRPATHISFELKAPPNQNQWAVWFGPAWIRVWQSYSRFVHITLGLFSLQPPLHPRGICCFCSPATEDSCCRPTWKQGEWLQLCHKFRSKMGTLKTKTQEVRLFWLILQYFENRFSQKFKPEQFCPKQRQHWGKNTRQQNFSLFNA